MRNKKIWMIGPDPQSMGGISSVAAMYLQHGLKDEIHYAVSFREGSALSKLLLAAQVFFQLLLALCCLKVELVHIHVATKASFWRKASFLLLAKLFNVPVLLHLHSGRFPCFYLEEVARPIQRLIKWLLLLADGLIVLTPSWQVWFQTYIGHDNIIVLANPVAIADNPSEAIVGRLLFLGRLDDNKGFYDLLPALAMLKAEGFSIKMRTGGDGDLNRAQTAIAEYGLNEEIELLGWVSGEDKLAEMRLASIYLLPSHKEGLPMGILEAMSFGITVVASQVGGIPDVIVNGKNGVLIEAGQVISIVDALRKLLQDQNYSRSLGLAGRCDAVKKYSVEIIISQLRSIYASLKRDSNECS